MFHLKKKQYLYAISYWFTDREGRTGSGCAQIYRKTKINTMEDFNYMLQKLKEDNRLPNVVICNIMLLGKVKVNGN